MNHTANHAIIEATVNSAIERIQNDPERSMRNMVDMAVMFCNGRFQKRFFETAQMMLESEDSSYYRIIPDLISNVDSSRITTFGINLGYHSCTKGARIIRKSELEHQCNIPWCIALDLKDEVYHQKKETYYSLIEEGQQLGIYTWFINPHSEILPTLELVEHFGDSAFIVTCQPEYITDTMLDEYSEIYNVFFAVNYGAGIENACSLLRKRRFLFSVIYKYDEENIDSILNNSILYDFCSLHSIFSLFYSDTACPIEKRMQVFEHTRKMRDKQCFQTIPFDLIHDVRFVDEIISEDAVSVAFDANGICRTYSNPNGAIGYNIFQAPLLDILKQVVPKE